MRKLNVCVVGLGHWGNNYIRLLTENSIVDNIYGCDIIEENLKLVLKRFPNVMVYKDYRDVLNTHRIDAAIIATGASLHFKIGYEFLSNGVHTLIEKPLCMIVEDGKKLIKIAKRKKLVLMVGHTFLYNNAIRKLKQIVQSKFFGKVLYITARRTHLGLIRPDVSVHWDLAPHDISIMNFILERTPKKVCAIGSQIISKNKIDVCFIHLFYDSNITAHITVSWIDANKVREIEVIGQNKKAVFNDLDSQEPIKIYEKGVHIESYTYTSFGEFKYIVRDGNIHSPKVNMSEPLKNQLDDFIQSIVRSKKPFSDGENGLEVIKVLEKMDISLLNNGMLIDI